MSIVTQAVPYTGQYSWVKMQPTNVWAMATEVLFAPLSTSAFDLHNTTALFLPMHY